MVQCQNTNSSSLECTANNKSQCQYENPRDQAPIQLHPFTKKFPTMTQRHKFGVRGQGWREGQLIKVGGHLKTKENIAGLGSKLTCKTEQKEFSCYLRTACLLEKKKILEQIIEVQGKGRKYVRHEETYICVLSRFLILEGNMDSKDF